MVNQRAEKNFALIQTQHKTPAVLPGVFCDRSLFFLKHTVVVVFYLAKARLHLSHE